jgi:hypothetical protein
MRIRNRHQLAEVHDEVGSSTRRTTIPRAALVIACALLFAGCSAGGAGGPTSIADACATLKTALDEVSTAVQSALAAARTPSELQSDLEGYVESVDTLAENAQNADVSGALGTLSEKLSEAAELAATLPTDAEGEVDPAGLADQKAAIEESLEKVNAACSEHTG